MKKLFVATALAASLTATSAMASVANESVRWRYFTAPGAEIRMQLPTSPTKKRRTSDTIIGDIHTDVWASRSVKGTFSVSQTYLPGIAVFFTPRSSMFSKATAQMVSELGAQEVARTDTDGLFEHELTYRIPSRNGEPAQLGRVRFVLQGKTLVAVNAKVPEGEAWRLDGFFKFVRQIESAPEA